jgi:transaldolase
MKQHEILSAGTSIWLDDLSRSKLTGLDPHSLPHRIENDGVRGVTTNPSIFGAAIVGADEYAGDIASLSGKSVEEVVRTLTTDDVRVACDLFHEIYSASKGVDGRVSIEVDPRLAHKTQETID